MSVRFSDAYQAELTKLIAFSWKAETSTGEQCTVITTVLYGSKGSGKEAK